MISPTTLTAALEGGEWGGPHHVTPSVLSADAGHGGRHGITLRRSLTASSPMNMVWHGRPYGMARRFGNMRCSGAWRFRPREASWKSGVRWGSCRLAPPKAARRQPASGRFCLDTARAKGMDERRKRAGHLVSKHRFVSAQVEAFLKTTVCGSSWRITPMKRRSVRQRPCRSWNRAGMAG